MQTIRVHAHPWLLDHAAGQAYMIYRTQRKGGSAIHTLHNLMDDVEHHTYKLMVYV